MRQIEIDAFDIDSINAAKSELEQMKQEIESRTETLKQRLADELREEIQAAYNQAVVEYDIPGPYPVMAQVDVSISSEAGEIIITAAGYGQGHENDAVWVEFGTGVHYNGADSGHPKATEFGYTIGSYGAGHGNQNVWGYKGDTGVIKTYGTPAQMPMYKACLGIEAKVRKIAKEVFND